MVVVEQQVVKDKNQQLADQVVVVDQGTVLVLVKNLLVVVDLDMKVHKLVVTVDVELFL